MLPRQAKMQMQNETKKVKSNKQANKNGLKKIN